jgi:predicted amidohydrolase
MTNNKEELRVALVQMSSKEEVHENYQFILDLLSKIEKSKQQIDLICFPENSLFMRVNDRLAVKIIDLQDLFFTKVAAIAKTLGCFIHLGSFATNINDKIFNSTLWVNPRGERRVGYQKMHLFDIELEGQKAIQESTTFAHGELPRIQNVFGWNVGESICYDIRFAELYNYYARNNVDLILIPAAFLATTGKSHWEILVKARAIESQAYVLASCQSGEHKNQDGEVRQTFGHSMLVDPWGREILNLKEDIGYEIKTISKSNILRVRRQIPMAQHRRDFFKGKDL